MYGGLFGDLPAAKNAKSTDKATKEKEEEGTSANTTTTTTTTTTANNNDTHNQTATSTKAFTGTTKTPSEPPKQPSSIVQHVGLAGTTMAFVPTAARRGAVKRPIQQSNNNHKRRLISSESISSKKADSSTDSTRIQINESLSVNPPPPPQVTSSTTPSASSAAVSTVHSVTTGNKNNDMDQEHTWKLRQEALKDPYDPFVPNDLLLYWEQQAVVQETRQLRETQQRILQEQEDLRKRMQDERNQLLQQGEYDKLMEWSQGTFASAASRGRGRGVSNLPAWLVQRQQQQQQQNVGQSTNKEISE